MNIAEGHALQDPDRRGADEPGRAATAEPVLSIIVVSYNTREMTLACLRSVYAETQTPFEILFVDNASSDGSAEAVAAEFPPGRFPNLTLMAETENHGFARANNIAAKRARGHYLLLLNPDTLVLDGAIDKLAAFATARPEARIWGGRTLFGDMRLNPGSCWRRMTLWGLIAQATGLRAIFRNSAFFNPEAYGGWDRSSERPVDIVAGCFLMISRADWQALGGFHRDFFMYGEEVDLCLRATEELHARPRITPEARIVHYAGASEKVRADKMVRLLRAKTLLITRHFPAGQRAVGRALLAAWPLSRFVALSVLSRLAGRPSWRESAANWAAIWARRGEWMTSDG